MDANLAHLVSWAYQSKGDIPPALTGPSVTLSPLPSPPTIFLFGGKVIHARHLTDQIWAMDLTTRVWKRLNAGQGPSPRYFHSMDVWEDKLVCFGGMSDSEPMSVHNDIWFFDCTNRRWLPQPSPLDQSPDLIPSARYAHLSAVSRGHLVISGGQHADNSWIYEINVYDLRQRRWVSKTMQPELQGQHSKGAYRSVAATSKQRVIMPKAGEAAVTQPYSIDEEGEGGQLWMYSNYDFVKVRRELDLFTPAEEMSDPVPPMARHTAPPSHLITDKSGHMRGSSQPPGLRFPTGGIIGSHFILCGLYLASSSAAFSIWSLDLHTMVWRHLEPAVLAAGSWNRAVLWPERGQVLVLGNEKYDLASDYSRRAVNFDQMAVINLETYGIYAPPRLEIPAKVQAAGMSALNEGLASDFEVECDDGRRVKCSRRILLERWPWFRKENERHVQRLSGVVRDAPALDIADTLLGNFTPARLTATTLMIPEPMPVCIALVQYFYTLRLSTPLQNRAPVLSALLFLAKQYDIERLAKLVVHALHQRIDNSTAVGIYEIATLAGEQNLQVRALSVAHASKGATTTRSERSGTSGSTGGEGRHGQAGFSSHSGPPASKPTSTGDEGHMGGSFAGEGTYRLARAESMTLTDDVASQVDALLAAMALDTTHDSPPSPIDPGLLGQLVAAAPIVPRRSDARPPPIDTPPSSRQYQSHLASQLQPPDLVHDREYTRPSSPTNTESTSGYPATPAESIRESFLLPPLSYPQFDSRSSSTSSSRDGHGSYGQMTLPPLPEESATLSRFRSVNGSMSSQSSFNSRYSLLPDRSDKADRVLDRSALVDRVHPDRVKQSTLENAGLFHRTPPPASSSTQAQALADQYARDPFGSDSTAQKHISTTSSALTTSTLSAQEIRGATPSSSAKSEYSVELGSQYSGKSLTPKDAAKEAARKRQAALDAFAGRPTGTPSFSMLAKRAPVGASSPSKSNAETASIFTTRSGGSDSSDKKQRKAEKKAAAAAAKEAKRAEAQAKFEELRSEQIAKMAIAKAELQLRAEAAKHEEPAPKPQLKSKFGRFGAKFTENALFPAGGDQSSMF